MSEEVSLDEFKERLLAEERRLGMVSKDDRDHQFHEELAENEISHVEKMDIDPLSRFMKLKITCCAIWAIFIFIIFFQAPGVASAGVAIALGSGPFLAMMGRSRSQPMLHDIDRSIRRKR